jgi:hypothetical protein
MKALDLRDAGRWFGGAVKIITRAADLLVRVAAAAEASGGGGSSAELREVAQLHAGMLRLAEESQELAARLEAIAEDELRDDAVVARLEVEVERLWAVVRSLPGVPAARGELHEHSAVPSSFRIVQDEQRRGAEL